MTWTSPRNWTVSIPLTAVNNAITLVGIDKNGNVIPGMSDSLTITMASTTTGTDGRYTVNIAPGAYNVKLTKTGYRSETFGLGVTGPSSTKNFTLRQ